MKDSSNRRAAKPVPARSNREQTKFDKWLLSMKEQNQLVDFVLDPSPYSVDELNAVPARVVEVDRYFILIEFRDHITEDDGAVWWVPKDAIKAAGHSTSNAPYRQDAVQ